MVSISPEEWQEVFAGISGGGQPRADEKKVKWQTLLVRLLGVPEELDEADLEKKGYHAAFREHIDMKRSARYMQAAWYILKASSTDFRKDFEELVPPEKRAAFIGHAYGLNPDSTLERIKSLVSFAARAERLEMLKEFGILEHFAEKRSIREMVGLLALISGSQIKDALAYRCKSGRSVAERLKAQKEEIALCKGSQNIFRTLFPQPRQEKSHD